MPRKYEGNFFKLPNRAAHYPRENDPLVTLGCLAHLESKQRDGRAWLSMREKCDDWGCGRKRIAAALKYLEEIGEIRDTGETQRGCVIWELLRPTSVKKPIPLPLTALRGTRSKPLTALVEAQNCAPGNAVSDLTALRGDRGALRGTRGALVGAHDCAPGAAPISRPQDLIPRSNDQYTADPDLKFLDTQTMDSARLSLGDFFVRLIQDNLGNCPKPETFKGLAVNDLESLANLIRQGAVCASTPGEPLTVRDVKRLLAVQVHARTLTPVPQWAKKWQPSVRRINAIMLPALWAHYAEHEEEIENLIDGKKTSRNNGLEGDWSKI